MKIGYQLYSALDLCQDADGLKDTIRKVAEMGYDGVEFFTYAGIPAGRLKELLAECGMEAMNSHVQLERWEADAEGEIIYAKEAGIPCVTIPWMAPELRGEEGFERVQRLCKRLVPLCKKHGVKLLYHNHDFEFARAGEGYVLEHILGADPGVGLELDTFWSYYAGVDPAAYMEKEKERLAMIHVKDYVSLEGEGGMPLFAAVGTGKMNQAPILDKAEALGLEWVIVEQDNSQIDLLRSAKLSADYLKNYFQTARKTEGEEDVSWK